MKLIKSNPFERAARVAWKPVDRRPPWVWAEENLTVDSSSPFPGKFRIENSPWIKEPLEDIADPSVSHVLAMCPAQTSKTFMMLLAQCWALANDPGPMLTVMASDEEAREMLNDRMKPLFENTPGVKERIEEGRYGVTTRDVKFKGIPFYLTGSKSKSKLQGKPIRWLWLDEIRNYPPWALSMAQKRTRRFWNAKVFGASTPGRANDEFHALWKKGSQHEYQFKCSCGHRHWMDFRNFEWDKNEKTKRNGVYDFAELEKTIRYVCPCCGREYRDEPHTRAEIVANHEYVQLNTRNNPAWKSYRWPVFMPVTIKWIGVVEEYLLAKDQAKHGNREPLRTFYTETLGEPWDDKMGEVDDFSFLDACEGDYSLNEPWGEEEVRFISADVQAKGGEHFWYVVRAFGPFAKSRLIAYGRCTSRAQLEEIREKHNVPISNAIIDSGYNASEIYQFCLSTGWKPFKGDDAEYFPYRDPRKKRTVRRIYQRVDVDPTIGQKGRRRSLPLYVWSNPMAKDLLLSFMRGLIGEFTIPKEVGREYLKQVTAEQRVEETDARGVIKYRWHKLRKDNHLFDCELMILVAAIISKKLQAAEASVSVE